MVIETEVLDLLIRAAVERAPLDQAAAELVEEGFAVVARAWSGTDSADATSLTNAISLIGARVAARVGSPSLDEALDTVPAAISRRKG